MLQSNFFALDGRTYLNNAIAIADSLQTIQSVFGTIKNYSIKFKRVITTQCQLNLSTIPLDGKICGQFDTQHTRFYFAYTEIDKPLSTIPVDYETVTHFSLAYNITNHSRDVAKKTYISEYGEMTSNDKVIFVGCDIPEPMVLEKYIESQKNPHINIRDIMSLGNKRYRYSVYLDDKLFSYRYSTIGELKK